MLHDRTTAKCVRAERAIVSKLDGDCHSPIGAYATIRDGRLTLRAAIGTSGGGLPVITASATVPAHRPHVAVDRVLSILRGKDADELMDHMAAAI